MFRARRWQPDAASPIALRFVITVERVGPTAEGEVFEATLVETAVL